ncbi:MAG: cobyrinate a,c-diamide synthase [Microcoleaceae cyanobacterium]
MTLIIAGERSGVGKTTITLALLATLKRQGLNIQSFKVGPDYIDPMFHQYITQKPCYNLDPILTSENYVKSCFYNHIQTANNSLIEGVMGLFDGIPDINTKIPIASTAHIANLLNIPILLVIDCRRLSSSIAAIVHGFTTFNSSLKFAGLILNRVASDRHLELLKTALEPLNLPILGVLRTEDNITLPDRHLGLIPTDELPQLYTILDQLAELGKRCFNWEKLLPLLQTESINITENNYSHYPSSIPVKIAVAKDAAFNFYYPDNLEKLQAYGAELIFWSPLKDPKIPPGVQGLYLGGGFPEVFAEKLSQNLSALQSIKIAIKSGMPTYAECGGLMYLCEKIVDFEQKSWSMVGIIPTTVIMGKRLKLGYYQAKILRETPLFKKGETIRGHEFHRSELQTPSIAPIYEMQRFKTTLSQGKQLEGWGHLPNLHASYFHLNWGDNLEIPIRFLRCCQQFILS